MGLQYHHGMSVPYESSGRTAVKARTRAALVAAVRELVAAGSTPSVEEAAEAASVSRTTAYRYFPNQRALMVAAHPEIEATSLLSPDAGGDVASRVDRAVEALTRIVIETEPQQRAMLRLSLEPGAAGDERLVLRQGRAIGWLEEALAPLRGRRTPEEIRRLALAIRSACGIESYVWLRDVAGLSADEAVELMRWSARALVRAALDAA